MTGIVIATFLVFASASCFVKPSYELWPRFGVSLRPQLQAIEAGGVGGVGVLQEQGHGGWVGGRTRPKGHAF